MKYAIIGLLAFSLWGFICFKVGCDLAEGAAYLVAVNDGVRR